MKILIAAKRVLADVTSEGICSSKYIAAIAGGGHEVTCISEEDARHAIAAEVPGTYLEVLAAPPGHRPAGRFLTRLTRRVSATGRAGQYTSQKIDAACAYATGYSTRVWEGVDRWRAALQGAVERQRPDVIIVRGAGREFEPHMAMLNWNSPAPWIAHYHDPYPASLYPEPYRQRTPFLSDRQERVHREIIEQCDAVTFPSRRLLEFVLTGALERHRDKAFVVPHIAGGAGASIAPADGGAGAADDAVSERLEPGCLNIVHTGTLLRERDPKALLRGFMAFVGGDTERRRVARLVFVGRADKKHTGGEWELLRRDGLLRAIDHRVDYRSALRISRAADCLAIVEANAAVSPFFPAKLADYLYLDKPIIALSPRESVTADMVGADHPLRIAPSDTAGAALALERVWAAWRAGRLGELAPAFNTAVLSDAAVRQHTEHIINCIRMQRFGQVA